MKYFKITVLFLFYILFFYISKGLLINSLESGYLDSLPDFFFKIIDLILYAVLSTIFIIHLINKQIKVFNFQKFRFNYIFLALVLALLFRFMEDPFINADYITNGFTKFGNEKFYQMSNDLVFKLILICFIGPFLEELVFRKMILGYLDRNFTSIVLSSFLFALIHVFNGFEILKVFSSFFFGIILGIVYYKGGLIYSILIHVFYNLLFFVSNYLCNELYEQILLKLDFGLFYWIILILSAIFFSIILFKYFLPITKLNESSIIIN